MDSALERRCLELVARERSGHTAVVEDNLLYVWGGYMSVADHEVFLPNDEIWVYDLERGVWDVYHMTGEVPPSMSGTCSCSLNGHMYIFGGCDDNGQTNQVEDVFWGWNNEVHVFDPMQASWSEPQTHGHAPAPRAAHASATIGGRGYICGGRVMETRTIDIHCLDLESWTWSEIIPVSSTPVGRSWHTLTTVSDSTLFLFGGLSVDCKPMSDGWLLDVETKNWREIEHPYKNKPRLWHTACPGKDSDVIVFGGSCDYILLVDTGHCNDALVFQMQPYPLFRICEDYIAKNVKSCEMLKDQLHLLPPKLLRAVQTRMSFYRPSKEHTLV
ncbi:kelch domain-containing protein 1 isoform X2 [Channa argus]|uniref:kelch domain-containing protein 1 isoform X2 n=1 Tax=Channa argus TaxID=215402 RepID=UPI003521FB6C